MRGDLGGSGDAGDLDLGPALREERGCDAGKGGRDTRPGDDVLHRFDLAILSNGEDDPAVPEFEIHELPDVPARLLHEVPSGDAQIGGPVSDELRDVLGPYHDRLKLGAEPSHERSVRPEFGAEPRPLEQVQCLVREASFVRYRDSHPSTPRRLLTQVMETKKRPVAIDGPQRLGRPGLRFPSDADLHRPARRGPVTMMVVMRLRDLLHDGS